MPQISISDRLALNALYDAFIGFGSAYIEYSGSSYYNLGSDPEHVTFNYGGYATYNGPQYSPMQFLRLMKGTVPTDFSGLTFLSSRSSDVLVSWDMPSATSWSTDNQKTYWLNGTPLVYASTGGIATWLWLCSGWDPGGPTGSVIHQAVFTVGTLGSGADFELLNTTVISGNGYRLVNGPRLTMATEWNY